MLPDEENSRVSELLERFARVDVRRQAVVREDVRGDFAKPVEGRENAKYMA